MNNKEKEILIKEVNRIKSSFTFDSRLFFDSYSQYYLLDIDAYDLEITEEVSKYLYNIRSNFSSEFPNSILIISWKGKNYKIDGEEIYSSVDEMDLSTNLSTLFKRFSNFPNQVIQRHSDISNLIQKEITELPKQIIKSQLDFYSQLSKLPNLILEMQNQFVKEILEFPFKVNHSYIEENQEVLEIANKIVNKNEESEDLEYKSFEKIEAKRNRKKNIYKLNYSEEMTNELLITSEYSATG